MIERDADTDAMARETEHRLFEWLTEMKESLEREIGELRLHVDQGFADLRGRFDAQSARLDRHAARDQRYEGANPRARTEASAARSCRRCVGNLRRA